MLLRVFVLKKYEYLGKFSFNREEGGIHRQLNLKFSWGILPKNDDTDQREIAFR